MVFSHLAYLALSVGTTVWVARTLQRNGRIFLRDLVLGNPELAEAVINPRASNRRFMDHSSVLVKFDESERRIFAGPTRPNGDIRDAVSQATSRRATSPIEPTTTASPPTTPVRRLRQRHP